MLTVILTLVAIGIMTGGATLCAEAGRRLVTRRGYPAVFLLGLMVIYGGAGVIGLAFV